MGDINLAATTLARAVELDPASVNARLLLAEIYLCKHDFALVQEQALEILKIHPQNFQARLTLGNAYMYRNKPTEAADTFNLLVESTPENPMGYYRLWLLPRVLGQYDAAMANFEKALSIYPRPVDVFTNVILVHGSNKEYPPTLMRCVRQLQEYADSQALVAVVYYLKGNLYLPWEKGSGHGILPNGDQG